MKVIFLLFVFLLGLPSFTTAKKTSAHAKTSKGWKYLDRFCFAETEGEIELTVTGTQDDHLFLIYTDHEDNWKEIYTHPGDQCAKLNDTSSETTGVYVFPVEAGKHTMTLHISDMARPRWYFAAAARCTEDKEVDLYFEIHWRNPSLGDSEEFGFNELGMLPLEGLAFAIFLLFVPVLFFAHLYLARKERLHMLFYFICVVVFFHVLSSILVVVHYAEYKLDGVGKESALEASQVFRTIGQLSFMTVLFLVAYGWTITTSHLSDKRYFICMVSGLAICHIFLFLEQYLWRDPANPEYIYGTGAGIAIICIRLLECVFFSVCVVFKPLRAETDPEKRQFYTRLLLVYSIWFAGIPISALVASLVDPWVRDITVETFNLFVDISALVILMYLFRPGHGLRIYTPHIVPATRLKLRSSNKVESIPHKVEVVHHEWREGFQNFSPTSSLTPTPTPIPDLEAPF